MNILYTSDYIIYLYTNYTITMRNKERITRFEDNLNEMYSKVTSLLSKALYNEVKETK